MHIKNKKGQSTVEYVLLVTAVVAVMIAFSTNQNSGLQSQLNGALVSVSNDMNSLAKTLSESQVTPSGYVTPAAPPYNIDVTPDVTKGVTTGTGG